MNRRQKKKAYKKRYGHNPPKSYEVYGIDWVRVGEAMGAALDTFGKMIRDAAKAIKEAWENPKDTIQNMNDEEYEAFLQELTPEQRGYAKAIRESRAKGVFNIDQEGR